MNRVPYRRVTPPRNSSARVHHQSLAETSQESTIIHKIIISGLLLVAVLIIGMSDFLEPLRSGVQDVLSGATTIGELWALVLDFGRNQLGFDNQQLYEPTQTLPTAIPGLWD